MDRVQVNIVRDVTSDLGTFGEMKCPNLTQLSTLELPWRNNTPFISCIPCGEYQCELVSTRKYKKVYQVLDVPGRTGILIHWGNWAGDKSKGLRSNVEGCILLGFRRWQIEGQLGVDRSRNAIKSFHSALESKPFTLRIYSAIEAEPFKVWDAF